MCQFPHARAIDRIRNNLQRASLDIIERGDLTDPATKRELEVLNAIMTDTYEQVKRAIAEPD